MSGLEAIAKLKSGPLFGDLVARVDRVVSALNRSHVPASITSKPEQRVKAIKCSLWGMIEATRQELALIDSPFFQRLRRIRQLGLTFLTYPTAGYSRFEHSLGAMHQAERMLRSVWSREGDAVDSGVLKRVRLAALFHDIGHLPLSHVSERYYDIAECRDQQLAGALKRTRMEVAKALSISEPKLAECLSVAVAVSPVMERFLTEQCRYDREDVAAATLAILGRPVRADEAYLAQMTSNVIDADKLDYMFRDASATGIPLAVDLERLLFKIRGVSAPAAQLPDGLKRITGHSDIGRVLGTDLAGAKALHELAVSRDMLYERVYLHHKTRAAERVALSLLGELALHPTDLLQHDDNIFFVEQLHADPRRERTVLALRNRDLPRRAFAISHSFLAWKAGPKDGRISEVDNNSWLTLNRVFEYANKRVDLEVEIQAEASQIAALLRLAAPDRVFLDTPPGSPKLDDTEFLLALPDGDIRPASEIPWFPSKAAARTGTPAGTFYVYATGTTDQIATVFVATETVLHRSFNLWFGVPALEHAKQNRTAIDDLKRRLEQASHKHFNGMRRLRAASKIARMETCAERIRTQAARFQEFSIGTEHRVTAESMTAFLDQFPEDLVEPMLRILEKVRYFGRRELGRNFRDTLGAGSLVPLLSQPVKSATHMVYFLKDASLELSISSLEEGLRSNDATLTFFDDCCVTGKQARTVVQIWFGLPPDLPNESEIAKRLSDEEQQLLRAKRLRFRFVYATHEAMESLGALLAALGLDADVAAMDGDERLAERILDGSDELRDFLNGVGDEVLATTKGRDKPTEWTAERCRDCALGYSGAQRLVVFSYNTPTGTLTPLWKTGSYRDAPWMPLFPRRGN